jgi:TraY domain
MGQKMTEARRVQVSLHLEEPVREQLEAAARRSVRSLSGEVTFRLKRSLECDRQIDGNDAAA